ncbi:MAG: hypothetical protein ACRDYA_05620 [Egibacteraceae bacterium]
MKRHVMNLAYARGERYARCRCGWEGRRFELRTVGRDQAIRAAEREAATHEAEPDQ